MLKAVTVPGAHALNYSDPQLIAEIIEAHLAGERLSTQTGADLSSRGLAFTTALRVDPGRCGTIWYVASLLGPEGLDRVLRWTCLRVACLVGHREA